MSLTLPIRLFPEIMQGARLGLCVLVLVTVPGCGLFGGRTTTAGGRTTTAGTPPSASEGEACKSAASGATEPWRRYFGDIDARRAKARQAGTDRNVVEELDEQAKFAESAVRSAGTQALVSNNNMLVFARATLGTPPEPGNEYYLGARRATVEMLRACVAPPPPSLDALPPTANKQHPLVSHFYRGVHMWVRQVDRPSLYQIDINGTLGRSDDVLGFLAADAAFHGFARAALEEGAFHQAVERIDEAPSIRDEASALAAHKILSEEFARATEASHQNSGSIASRKIGGIADVLGASKGVVFNAAHKKRPVAVKDLRNIFVALRSMESRAGESEPFRALNTRIAIDLLKALVGT